MTKDSEDDDTGVESAQTSKNPKKDRISDALKQAYDDVANAPLPDRLSTLLEQLKVNREQ